MGRTKKQPSVKEPVRIRFKELSDGSQSIYLDIYYKGKRKYEFLKLYIVPGNSQLVKAQNEASMKAANAIKSKRIIELTNDAAGLKNTSARSKMLLSDWMQTYYDDHVKKGSKDNHGIRDAQRILNAYSPGVAIGEVDKKFCLGFLDYLRNDYVSFYGRKLAPFSIISIFSVFRGAMNAAVRADIIPDNPVNQLSQQEKVKWPESKREYLTIDEVKKLIGTPCKRENIKAAFLFACYCGLRISDVQSLCWKDIVQDGEQWRANIVMQKTKAPLYLPLSKQARKWMPERGDAQDEDTVFHGLPKEGGTSKCLQEWVESAGINKKVTFHVSRHTFATMMLTLGADLYTVSKLLGHTSVKTTQIYAKIINKKRDDAIGLIDREFAET